MECKTGATTKRPNVWDEFKKTFVHVGDPPVEVRKGKCKMCDKLIAADLKLNDTSAMWKHHAFVFEETTSWKDSNEA